MKVIRAETKTIEGKTYDSTRYWAAKRVAPAAFENLAKDKGHTVVASGYIGRSFGGFIYDVTTFRG